MSFSGEEKCTEDKLMSKTGYRKSEKVGENRLYAEEIIFTSKSRLSDEAPKTNTI